MSFQVVILFAVGFLHACFLFGALEDGYTKALSLHPKFQCQSPRGVVGASISLSIAITTDMSSDYSITRLSCS